MDNPAALSIHFSPLIASSGLGLTALVAAFLIVLSVFFFRRGAPLRALCAAAFLLALLNPSVVHEKRESTPDVLTIVADRSPSQSFGERKSRTDAALEFLKGELEEKENLNVRIIEAPAASDGIARETKLFDALDRSLSDVPEQRRAGVVFITDGQVHDVPKAADRFANYAPVHVLLTGEHDEKDRQLIVTEAPAYGIVGQSVSVHYRVEDSGATGETTASVILRQNNGAPVITDVPINTDQTLDVQIDHAGQNIFDLQTAPLDGELTLANNRVPLIVNGVRDRLRVMLISGQPYAGERTWRDILTADPGVDLVHFTILREPDKIDMTPQNELSLIAFPFRELFETKLYEFDLIIFDGYRLNRIMPNFYFDNIAKYVRQGGALLEASGTASAGVDSIYNTALRDVFPAFPTGDVIEKPFVPTVTDLGKRHPVTQGLGWTGKDSDHPNWGAWLRQIDMQKTTGDTVMSGADGKPLLILNRVEKGRVAQLASDQIWLWSRGYQGGGPQADLLRRLGHWLMKEPELEENALDAQTQGKTILIRRRSLKDDAMKVTVTLPDETTKKEISLAAVGNGWLEGRMETESLGVHTVDDGTQQRFVIVGDINPPELRGVRTTSEILDPLFKSTGGSVQWLTDNDAPEIRFLPQGRKDYGGRGWIGLRENNAYTVTGTTENPILPAWAWAIILLCLSVGTWFFEGRRGAG